MAAIWATGSKKKVLPSQPAPAADADADAEVPDVDAEVPDAEWLREPCVSAGRDAIVDRVAMIKQ